MKNLFYLPLLFLVWIAKSISFNWIIGSYRSVFSCSTMLAPVMAKHFGFGWLSLFFISPKLLITSQILFVVLHRTPLFFAAYAYQRRSWVTSLVVPFACMILFVNHNVGQVAWCYSLYWLIPMGLYFVPDCLVARALTASFVAHGLGSVIWLYTTSIDASVWIALIPVVICERLLMAGGMVVVDDIMVRCKRWMQQILIACKTGLA